MDTAYQASVLVHPASRPCDSCSELQSPEKFWEKVLFQASAPQSPSQRLQKGSDHRQVCGRGSFTTSRLHYFVVALRVGQKWLHFDSDTFTEPGAQGCCGDLISAGSAAELAWRAGGKR